GFAAIHFKITGPVLTMSSLETAPQECAEMAGMLLKENSCRVCIVTVVEGHRALADAIGEPDVREGACTLVLSTEPNARDLGLVMRAEMPKNLTSLNASPDPQTRPLMSIARSGFFKFAARAGS